MKKVTDFKVKGKRVLVRCDFNVPLDREGRAVDDFRIRETIPTIEYLLRKGAKVILMSHFGDPKGKKIKELSLAPIQEKLMEYLDCSITKADDCIGQEIEEWTKEMQEGEILLLENLRFYPGEEINDPDFAQALSRLGDIFINDAFGASHREHASVVGVTKFLASGIGLLFEKEIKNLNKILKNPQRPLIGIIGGAKLSSKIKPIGGLLEKVDYLLLGGKIANTLLADNGLLKVDSSTLAEIEEVVQKIDLNNPKIILSQDVMVMAGKPQVKKINEVKENELALDIGPKTREAFSEKIKEARTIFWSGPLGKVDETGFAEGSLVISQAIKESKAFSAVGGGDTVAFLAKNNLLDNFNYVSTGGGAMLEYLSGEKLPAISALEGK